MPKLRQKNIERMHRKFADNAELWDEAEQAVSLRRYCFKYGITHMLINNESVRSEMLLTNLNYCSTRLELAGASEALAMAGDFERTYTLGRLTFGV